MPGLKSITDFKNRLSGGGARPNLFEVELSNLPEGVEADWPSSDFKFLCKTAALPASNISAIEVPFRGKTLKVAGDRTFDTWTITIINDENFAIRKALEKWMRYMNSHETARGPSNPSSYYQDATVYQLGRTVKGEDQVLQAYSFFGIFPTNISQIDLSYDSTDTIEEFSVEFQVQYWKHGDTRSDED